MGSSQTTLRPLYYPKLDPIRVPRIENWVPRIREIGSLQVHTGYLTLSLKIPELNYVKICHEAKLQDFVKMQMIRNQPKTFKNKKICRESNNVTLAELPLKINTTNTRLDLFIVS